MGQLQVDPALMGTGPIPSSKKALDLAGWSIKDVDLFEINEALRQSLAVLKIFIPDEKVNVNGDAIAIGANCCLELEYLLL